MNSHTDKKYKPFWSGSQSADWIAKNCGTCKKGFDNNRNRFRCDWEMALCIASIEDGQVTEEVAKAIGYLDQKEGYIWECPGWERRRKGSD